MDHLAIVEKLVDDDSVFESGSALYIFSAAIYDSWIAGTELEKNLIKRIVSAWVEELIELFDTAYRSTKYDPERPERDVYFEKWVSSMKSSYKHHGGILCALEEIEGLGVSHFYLR